MPIPDVFVCPQPSAKPCPAYQCRLHGVAIFLVLVLTWWTLPSCSVLAQAPTSADGAQWQAVILDHTTPGTLQQSSAGQAQVIVENRGSATWPEQGNVRLSYHWLDADGTVIEYDGMRTLLPQDVAPGQSIALDAAFVAPDTPGDYLLQWQMVAEGIAWLEQPANRPDVTVAVVVTAPPWYEGVRAEIVSHDTPDIVYAGDVLGTPVTLKNVGDVAWPDEGLVRLAFHWTDDQGERVPCDERRTYLPREVSPGETVSLMAELVAPAEPADLTLQWQMVVEGVTWLEQPSGSPAPTASVHVKRRHVWSMARRVDLPATVETGRWLIWALAGLAHAALHLWLALRLGGSRYARLFETLLLAIGTLYAALHLVAFSWGLSLARGLAALALVDALAVAFRQRAQPQPASATRPSHPAQLRAGLPTWIVAWVAAAYALRWLLVATRITVLQGFDAYEYHVPFAIHLQQGNTPWGLIPSVALYPVATSLAVAWLATPDGGLCLMEWTNLPLAMLALGAMGEITRLTLGDKGWRWGLAMGLALLLTPLGRLMLPLSADMGFTAFFMALSALIVRILFQRRLTARNALMLGMAAGLMIGTKPTGLAALAVSVGVAIAGLALLRWRYRYPLALPRRWGALALAVLLVALTCGGVWYLRNWVVYGSPLSPIGVRIGEWTVFPGATYDELSYHRSMANDLRLLADYRLAPRAGFFIAKWFGAGIVAITLGLVAMVAEAALLRRRTDREGRARATRRVILGTTMLAVTATMIALLIKLPYTSLELSDGLSLRYFVPLVFFLCASMVACVAPAASGTRRWLYWGRALAAWGMVLAVGIIGSRIPVALGAPQLGQIEPESLLLTLPLLVALAWQVRRPGPISRIATAVALAGVLTLTIGVTASNHPVAWYRRAAGRVDNLKGLTYVDRQIADWINQDVGGPYVPRRVFVMGRYAGPMILSDLDYRSPLYWIDHRRLVPISEGQRSSPGDYVVTDDDQDPVWLTEHWLRPEHQMIPLASTEGHHLYKVHE